MTYEAMGLLPAGRNPFNAPGRPARCVLCNIEYAPGHAMQARRRWQQASILSRLMGTLPTPVHWPRVDDFLQPGGSA
jgi:hypothetical protein